MHPNRYSVLNICFDRNTTTAETRRFPETLRKYLHCTYLKSKICSAYSDLWSSFSLLDEPYLKKRNTRSLFVNNNCRRHVVKVCCCELSLDAIYYYSQLETGRGDRQLPVSPKSEPVALGQVHTGLSPRQSYAQKCIFVSS